MSTVWKALRTIPGRSPELLEFAHVTTLNDAVLAECGLLIDETNPDEVGILYSVTHRNGARVEFWQEKALTWEIRVHLGATGVVVSSEVWHDGARAHAWHNWTDRTTLEEVVTWANRATRCDAELTSLHLKFV